MCEGLWVRWLCGFVRIQFFFFLNRKEKNTKPNNSVLSPQTQLKPLWLRARQKQMCLVIPLHMLAVHAYACVRNANTSTRFDVAENAISLNTILPFFVFI